ncbi:MAG TPA: hypothetical protein IGR64_10890 [Leptolyngbyaceae cyanobacterium M65_K2018_010]|nr:hypothetical protein [Leptolyngbyaceae cyanobacterium M65_K2018_010]
MSRPYNLSPWSTDAIRELIDTLNCLNNGLYESPTDLADCLQRTSESVRLALDPDEFDDDLPELLNAIAVLYIALQLAANEAHVGVTNPMYYASEGHAGTFERWVRNALETVSLTPGVQQRDLIAGTLSRLQQLQVEMVQPSDFIASGHLSDSIPPRAIAS